MFNGFSNTFRFGKMKVVVATPPSGSILTTGLLAYLDASENSSYSGSGSTWTDIQGSNDGTINGPTFSSSNGGYFSFDGVNDTIQIADSADMRATVGGIRTIQTWVRIKSYDDNDGIWGKQYGSPTYDGFSLAIKVGNVLRLQMNGSSVNGGYNSGNNVFNLNTWIFVTAIVRFGGGAGSPSLVYVNDNSTAIISANNTESSIPSIDAPFVFGRDVQEGTDYANIDIGALYVYNAALTTTQIADNYNATKTRFGL